MEAQSMKTNGKSQVGFGLRFIAALVSIFSWAPRVGSNTGDGNYAQGRDAFMSVSAGRQHNVKNRHPL
jgi:hypothetical protein